MALSQVTGSLANWWLTYRYGSKPAGTVYNCLVSDLAVGDYLVGTRATITVVGAVSGSNKSFTLDRLGKTMTVSWPTASAIQIIR